MKYVFNVLSVVLLCQRVCVVFVVSESWVCQELMSKTLRIKHNLLLMNFFSSGLLLLLWN